MMHASLLHALDRHVAERGAQVFTRHVAGDRVEELTFAAFGQRAAQFARFLTANGCTAGDIVVIFLSTSPDVLASFVGAMMAGGVPALMPLPSAKQHAAIYWRNHRDLLRRMRLKLILTDRATAAQMTANELHRGRRRIVTVEDVPGDAAPVPMPTAAATDLAVLQHSSGTTSLKKGVMLSHGAILRQVESYAASLDATADDGIASWLPLYHDMGLIACAMTPLVLGQTVTILDPFAWAARPATLLDAVQRYDCRFVWMPNFAFEHMARAVPAGWTGDLSGVRAFVNCSEACKPETFDRFRARFAAAGLRGDALQTCYAMAETVFAVSQTRLGAPPRVLEIDRVALREARVATDPVRRGDGVRVLSNGAVLAGLDVSIRDPDTRATLGERAVGEIAITGAFLFDGYHKAPAITAERLEGGTYFTRDMGFLADGELYVLGRRDDLIIVNGRNLHAHEVEALAADLPGLKPGRAVAFGVFSEATASEELVIVAERAGADVDEAEIARVLRERVFDETGIDVKDLLIVDPDWLVKTTSGKISREQNRAKYLSGRGAQPAIVGPARTASTDVFAAIAQVIARLFDHPVGRISRQTVAAEVSGWDSLAHATLILEVEKALQITFDDAEMFSFPDVGTLVDRAAALQGTGQSDRTVFEDENVSIVRIGEHSDGTDLIIFTGAAERFGGRTMMDFASTLTGTGAHGKRKFFVTDKKKRWFTDSFDRIADTINAASPGDKVVIGNSMGGYGALKVGAQLDRVRSILAFAPQPTIPKPLAEALGRADDAWFVRPVPDVPTCIIFGEVDDESGKRWIEEAFATDTGAPMLTLVNCGHNVVFQLNKIDLLKPVLLASLEPETLVERVRDLLRGVAPSAQELMAYVLSCSKSRRRRAMRHLMTRMAEEGLPPLDQEQLTGVAGRWYRQQGALPVRREPTKTDTPIDVERLRRRIGERRRSLDRRRRDAAKDRASPPVERIGIADWIARHEARRARSHPSDRGERSKRDAGTLRRPDAD